MPAIRVIEKKNLNHVLFQTDPSTVHKDVICDDIGICSLVCLICTGKDTITKCHEIPLYF